MLLVRVLPLIVSLAGCACTMIPKTPNYDGENHRFDKTYQPPIKILKEPAYRDDVEKAGAIAEAFRHSWMGYYTYAFPKDTLHPLSRTFENNLSGFGSTAIESLTTAIIMGEKAIVDRILWFISSATFTVTKLVGEEVDVYEATVRLIGSMVSAYDLLNGPYRKNAIVMNQMNALLDQSILLADALKVAFGSKTRIPAGGILMTPMIQRSGRLETTLGAAGGMGVELDAIHHRSGLKKLWKNFVNGFKALVRQPILHDEIIPGLFPDMLNTKQGGFFSKQGGFTKNTAPFYSGMMKLRNLDAMRYKRTGVQWAKSAEAMIEHLTSYPKDHENLTFLGAYRNSQRIPRADITSCSAGAMFILGGVTLGKQRYIEFGLRIAESCWTVASSMPSGLPPRQFKWVDVEFTAGTMRNPLPPVHFEALANQTGFWPTQRSYTLGPDLLETMYYAYRITGDTKWQDRAWDMFVSINSSCRVANGFVGINDVTVKDGYDLEGNPVMNKGQWINRMEGEWMSRTLKYLYLIFAPEGPWQLQWNADGPFVFSHGGHLIQKPLWRSRDTSGKQRRPILLDWDEIEVDPEASYHSAGYEG
ncbi:Mannosyl-oligosaccharide alpha-1,2-mannosidase 1B [Fusarium piperis]|uniref:alpha-1,2-Mannosidase n=1 Tax=Fusarium piperis TaxID=1435070 RepID=A0A9W9BK92_9HYPO|nr:Mannosyl-oligosaccharide alpha-1,2-mannosidase 1B [Fusarium piperis]